MRTMYILRTDDRPTTDRPTSHFRKFQTAIYRQRVIRSTLPLVGSRVGFSRSADRVTLIVVLQNPKWRPAAILENVEWPHFCNGSCNSLRVWFYASVFRSADQIQDHGRQPSCIIIGADYCNDLERRFRE